MKKIIFIRNIKILLNVLLIVLGILATVSVILLAGFNISDKHLTILYSIIDVTIILFVIQEFIRLLLISDIKKHFKKRWFELLLSFSILLNEIFQKPLLWVVQNIFWQLKPHDVLVLYLILTLMILMISMAVKAIRYNHLIRKIQLHPGALFAISFGIIITVGSLMLLLPKATIPNSDFSVIDAIFTSTSAVCVTGLIVVDTATVFTFTGKLIILLLIQIGGLGVMTITTFFALFFGSGLSYKFRIIMGDLLSSDSLSEITSILKKIVFFTIIIELIGAFQLYVSLPGSVFPLNQEKLFNSIFHSVSAFCNAGFSLYSLNLMDESILTNMWFNTVILILIVCGGIGFPVLYNFYHSLQNRKSKIGLINHINLNSKIVIITTLVLIVLGVILLFITDIGSNKIGTGFFDRIYNSLFLSISSRTAGFNNFNIDVLTGPELFVIIGLMWIGASPGSTGGGIKTTTFAVAFLFFINYLKGKDKLDLHYRNIDITIIRKSFLIIFASLIFLFIGTFLLLWFEPDKNLMELLFETTSAISTVGLSMGITSHLGTGGKWIIIVIMFAGRIGILSFLLAFVKPRKQTDMYYPNENIIM